MPFTVSHIAAIVPIYAHLGRFRVPSALAIGSMTPDAPYFLPIDIGRLYTHNAWGLIWFCLPVGVSLYVLYHLFIKHPLIALLPESIAHRASGVAGQPRALPSVPWPDVLGAVLIGACTHDLWDAFTHRGAVGVAMFPVLRSAVGEIDGMRIYVYMILQHASTLLGLAVLSWWTWRWLGKTPARRFSGGLRLSGRAKLLVAAAIGGVAIANALIAVGPYLASSTGTRLSTLPTFTFTASTLSGATAALLTFCLLWHIAALRVTPR